jgi:o-succinylbenzoate---CoA ligase
MNQQQLSELFFTKWNSGNSEFDLKTSGSTGDPKTIQLQREWMIWSAKNTAKKLEISATDKILCCIPVDKVGGLMMLVRAKVWDIDIEITEPSLNPLKENTDANIISLTPLQLFHVMADNASLSRLLTFKHAIIGGGELSPNIENILKKLNSITKFWHSYGMTETYSHIALRDIQTEVYFTVFEDILIKTNEQGCLMIKCPFNENYIETTDMVEIIDLNQLVFKGRYDNLINSGGIKLNPEMIESLIVENTHLKEVFYISSIKDEGLGEKIVLVCLNKKAFENIDFNFLKRYNPYAIPKQIIEIVNFPYNEGLKINRKELVKVIEL